MNEVEQAKSELRAMGISEAQLDSSIETLSKIAANTKIPLPVVAAKFHLFSGQVNS
jgi:hypothetical protein